MGIGSSFHIHLPASGKDAAHYAPISNRALHTREHLLLIEDDKALQTIFDVTLSMRGFSVSAATTAAHGLALLKAGAGSFSLAIVDLHIPIEECAALIREMRAESGRLKIIVLGGASPGGKEVFVFEPPVELLPKAVTGELLVGTVTRALG